MASLKSSGKRRSGSDEEFEMEGVTGAQPAGVLHHEEVGENVSGHTDGKHRLQDAEDLATPLDPAYQSYMKAANVTASPLRKRTASHPHTMDEGLLSRPRSAGKFDEREERDTEARGMSKSIARPPSFAESQFHTIIRRQRKRRVVTPLHERLEMGLMHSGSQDQSRDEGGSVLRDHHGHMQSEAVREADYLDHKGALLKIGRSSSGPNKSQPLNSYPFAGWGSMSMLEVTSTEMEEAKKAVDPTVVNSSAPLGQFLAAGIAGNAVTGSIFYALPSVIAAGGVWAPLCFVLAALSMMPVIAVINGLTSAMKTANAGSYSYFLNVTGRSLALVAAGVTILDAVSAGAVSSATAATYVSAEAPQIPMQGFTVIFAVVLTAICLSGVKDSAYIALSIFSLHNLTMVVLLTAGAVSWARNGSGILKENWYEALHVPGSPANLAGKSIARSIFDGTVVAFVGLTGFEMSVSYASSVKPGAFPKALRNVWVLVALLEAPAALLVTAILPFSKIIEANNILASTAAAIAGRGLRLFIVIDASIVLCGGILSGALSSTGALLTLAKDGTLPPELAWCIKQTGAPALCFLFFLILCIVMCATSGFSQLTVSSVYSIVFLMVLTLFGLAAVHMLYSRPLMPHRKLSLVTILVSLGITITALAGNVALSPVSVGQSIAYAAVLVGVLLVWAYRVPLIRVACIWMPGQMRPLRRCLFGLERRAAEWVTSSRKKNKVVFLTNTDDLSTLIEAIQYIESNEPGVGRVILVHCYESVSDIPPELESNHQLVDEAFPHITVDLVFVEAEFSAATLWLLAQKLKVVTTRFFTGCPSQITHQEIFDLSGARVIMD
ncbi:unnamed protein product [Sympodiomycopsis kandeliae]